MSDRAKYQTRQVMLRTSSDRERVFGLLNNAPMDPDKPLEVLIREEVKARKPDQSALMWAGPLKDIASQAWINGRQYSAEVWHEYFKCEYLPEVFDPEHCREGYRKWDHTPKGDRVLVGSTTQLTVRGMAIYTEKIHAEGANMGVKFHANPKEERWG